MFNVAMFGTLCVARLVGCDDTFNGSLRSQNLFKSIFIL